MNGQLPLDLRWPPRQRFQYFHAGVNAAALASVREAATTPGAAWPLVVGDAASGKSHLLVAACRAAAEAERRVQYVPLARLGSAAADVMAGSTGNELVAVDDVHTLAGDDAAEQALFDLYNRMRDAGGTLLASSREPSGGLGLNLPDLRSRLGACTQAVLKPLNDAERRQVLQAHAADRGIQLDTAVLDWLFARHPRDLETLHDLLERIDSASLAAQRRITIPFLRDYLRQDQAAPSRT